MSPATPSSKIGDVVALTIPARVVAIATASAEDGGHTTLVVIPQTQSAQYIITVTPEITALKPDPIEPATPPTEG
jgi:hypothetical protein